MRCNHCDKKIKGRTDKRYCNPKCKSAHYRLYNKKPQTEVSRINKILAINRRVLYFLMDGETRKKIDIPTLEKNGFKLEYCTKLRVNNQGKIYFHIYDFAYLRFGTDTILAFNNGLYWKNMKSETN